MYPTHARTRNRSALARSFFACLTFSLAGGAVAAPAVAAPDAKVRDVQVLRIRHIPASTAATLIRPALSDAAQVALDDRTSALVVTDYPENMERVRAVLEAVDEKAPATPEVPAPPKTAPAADPQPNAASRPAAADEPAGLEEALGRSQTYQAYLNALMRVDEELAARGQSGLGENHPKVASARAKREFLLRQLDNVREDIRLTMMVDHGGAFPSGEALGFVVSRVPPVLTMQLKLPRGAGLVVDRVKRGGPAEAADIMPYDVLVRLDGQLLVNGEQFEVLAGSMEAGKEVQLELYRDGESLKRTVKIPPATGTQPTSRPQ